MWIHFPLFSHLPFQLHKSHTLALPISSTTPPILTNEQYEHLGSVFEDFSTLAEGQVFQLDTSLTGFELFMTESSHHAPMRSTVQTKSCLVTMEIQLGSMPMVSTIPVSTDGSFNLPAWLSRITMKRKKVVVP